MNSVFNSSVDAHVFSASVCFFFFYNANAILLYCWLIWLHILFIVRMSFKVHWLNKVQVFGQLQNLCYIRPYLFPHVFSYSVWELVEELPTTSSLGVGARWDSFCWHNLLQLPMQWGFDLKVVSEAFIVSQQTCKNLNMVYSHTFGLVTVLCKDSAFDECWV